jgi:3-methyladenine DNA glycosylase AlkD
VDPQLTEIKKQLRLRMNGITSTAMRQSGLDYKLNYGLDAFLLKEVASKHQPSVELADKLWIQPSRECKILATLLHPREAFDAEKAEKWLQECTHSELIEQLCFNLLQHAPYVGQLLTHWSKSNDPIKQEAGIMLALRMLIRKDRPFDIAIVETAAQAAKSQSTHAGLRLAGIRLLDRLEWDRQTTD